MDDIKVVWKPKAKELILEEFPDKIVYTIASMTLDMSYTTIPLGETGNLRKTSKSAGVRGSNKDYYIGSYTNYAKFVWLMPESTNWTTPGTDSQWYKRYWEKHKTMIVKNALERNKLK